MVLSRRAILAGSGAAVASIALQEQQTASANTVDAQAAKVRSSAMEIVRSGSQSSQSGAREYFSGSVRVDSRFQRQAPARIGGAIVTFEPGARTAWHTHPLGQTLIVVSGCGWVQIEGGPKEEIRAGDIVWFAPGEKHWHGATATTAMSHIAIAEALDGRSVDWLEHVSDEQYRG
jgi:4-carboxymuconolactone decarboxylase